MQLGPDLEFWGADNYDPLRWVDTHTNELL